MTFAVDWVLKKPNYLMYFILTKILVRMLDCKPTFTDSGIASCTCAKGKSFLSRRCHCRMLESPPPVTCQQLNLFEMTAAISYDRLTFIHVNNQKCINCDITQQSGLLHDIIVCLFVCLLKAYRHRQLHRVTSGLIQNIHIT